MPVSRIILADDHKIFRAGLKSLIDQEKGFKVVGEAKDGEALLEELRSVACDLVVLDLSMPQMDGMAAIKVIRREFPKVKILVLTMQKDHEHFRHAIASGALGYVLKEDAYEELILAIKLVLRGKNFVSEGVSRLVTQRYIRSLDDTGSPSLEILTPRERQVLRLIADGLSNKDVAGRLKISIRTVETHRANLTNKLGIKSAARLTKFAISKGIN